MSSQRQVLFRPISQPSPESSLWGSLCFLTLPCSFQPQGFCICLSLLLACSPLSPSQSLIYVISTHPSEPSLGITSKVAVQDLPDQVSSYALEAPGSIYHHYKYFELCNWLFSLPSLECRLHVTRAYEFILFTSQHSA